MKNKILYILIIVFLIIGMTGCGNKNDNKNEEIEKESKEENPNAEWQNEYINYLKENLSFSEGETKEISFYSTNIYDNPVMVITTNAKTHNVTTFVLDDSNPKSYTTNLSNEFNIRLIQSKVGGGYGYYLYGKVKNEPCMIDIVSLLESTSSSTSSDYMYCYGNINEFNAKYNVLNIEPTKEKITDLNNIDEIVKKLTDTNKINKKYSEELTPEIEEATKVITAGKYTLQYGRYTNDFVDITINADNTCHFKDTDYKINSDCTFEIKQYSGTEFDGSYVSGYHIIFHIKGQSDKYFNINGNNKFTDTRNSATYQA